MARNKNGKFGAADGFNFGDEYKISTQEVQDEQEDCTISTISTTSLKSIIFEEEKTIGSTQGKKGHKLKRINMAFSDANHEFITKESRKLGISATEFTNKIIEAYRQN